MNTVKVPWWVIAIATVVVLAAPTVWAFAEFRSSLEDYADEQTAKQERKDYRQAVKQRERSLAGCRATNVTRAELHGFLTDAAEARHTQARLSETPAERRANAEAARDYQRRAKRLVAAVAEEPKEKGSAKRNCLSAYPEPEPPR